MPKNQIALGSIFKVIGVILLVILLYYLRDLILLILVSVVIASAIEPATRWLGKYHIPRVLAVLAVYILAFVVVLVLIPYFVFPILADLSEISATLPATIAALPIFGNPDNYFSTLTGNIVSHITVGDIFVGVRDSLFPVEQGFAKAAGQLFSGFFGFILTVVISFYLAVRADGIENFLRVVTPLNQEQYVISLWKRSQKKIGLWMQGQLLLGLIMGVIVFLGLTILQVKYALILAILAAVFELIPFFGPILSAVPAVLLGFSTSVTLGFMVLGLYTIMQQFENHLIYPLVVKKIIGVPPLLVILSLLVGARLAGLVGIILAVPIATVLMELAEDAEKNKYLFRRADAQ